MENLDLSVSILLSSLPRAKFGPWPSQPESGSGTEFSSEILLAKNLEKWKGLLLTVGTVSDRINSTPKFLAPCQLWY
jgi:hypothetical protein